MTKSLLDLLLEDNAPVEDGVAPAERKPFTFDFTEETSHLPNKPMGFMDRTAHSFSKGVASMGEGLSALLPDSVGDKPEEWFRGRKEAIEKVQAEDPVMGAAMMELDKAEGFWESASTIASNPTLFADFIVSSAAQMLPGLGAAKGAQVLGKLAYNTAKGAGAADEVAMAAAKATADKIGKASAVAGASGWEGLVAGGQVYTAVEQKLMEKGYSQEDAQAMARNAAAKVGTVTAAVAGVGSGKLLADVATRNVTEGGVKGAAKGIGIPAAEEGVQSGFEENVVAGATGEQADIGKAVATGVLAGAGSAAPFHGAGRMVARSDEQAREKIRQEELRAEQEAKQVINPVDMASTTAVLDNAQSVDDAIQLFSELASRPVEFDLGETIQTLEAEQQIEAVKDTAALQGYMEQLDPDSRTRLVENLNLIGNQMVDAGVRSNTIDTLAQELGQAGVMDAAEQERVSKSLEGSIEEKESIHKAQALFASPQWEQFKQSLPEDVARAVGTTEQSIFNSQTPEPVRAGMAGEVLQYAQGKGLDTDTVVSEGQIARTAQDAVEAMRVENKASLAQAGQAIANTPDITPDMGEIRVVDPGQFERGVGVETTGKIGSSYARVIQGMGRALGREVVFFEQVGQTKHIDGFADAEQGRIYLNRASSGAAAFHVVAGHEFFHTMPEDIKGTFIEAVKGEIPQEKFDALVQYVNQGKLGEAGQFEEIAADLFGNRFNETEFFDRVLGKIENPTMAQKVMQFVRHFIDRVIEQFSGAGNFETDQVVSNLENVREAAVSAMQEYMARQATGKENIAGRPASAYSPEQLTQLTKSKGAVSERAQMELKRRSRVEGYGEPNTDAQPQAMFSVKRKKEDASDVWSKETAKGEREYKLNAERGERKVDQNAKLSAPEEQVLRVAAQKAGLNEEEVLEEARRTKARFPESDGWSPPVITGVKKKKGKDDAPAKKGGKNFELEFKGQSYGFNAPPGWAKKTSPNPHKPESREWIETMAARLTKEVADLTKRAKSGDKTAKAIIEHKSWYRGMTERLRDEFGGFADAFADLLGATSPNTPVNTNWKFSVDLLKRFVRGDFDEQLSHFEEKFNEGMGPKEYRDSFPDKLLRQISGAQYGINSANAAKAMIGMWRAVKHGDAPKARNFSLNLIGQSDKATIDVWAARLLQRLAGAPRLATVAEGGVDGNHLTDVNKVGGAFGFGQKVFEEAAKRLNKQGIDITPPDLQAVAWFMEKELWTKNDWTSAIGEGGSFEEEADKMPLSRFQAGATVETLDHIPTDQEMAKAAEGFSAPLKDDADVVAYRALPTVGMYNRKKERSFDQEVLAKKGWNPSKWIANIARISKESNQDDAFVSRAVPAGENNPNARPGVEVYLRTPSDLAKVQPVLQQLVSKGVDGFTMVVDPLQRRAGEGGKDTDSYLGIRMQYVPEIAMRWYDEASASPQEKADYEALTSGDQDRVQAVMDAKAEQIDDAILALESMPEVAFAKRYKYDTLVMGKENYDDYTDAGSGKSDQAFGGEGSGQSAAERLQAAARRLQGGGREDGAGDVLLGSPDGKPEGQVKLSTARKQTTTPEFKKWFGDSKVVDPDGQPLVVYHGTVQDVSEFKGDVARRTKGGRADAFYFTVNPAHASTYAGTAQGSRHNPATNSYENVSYGMETGGNVMPVYLSLKNPLEVDAAGKGYQQVENDAFSRAKSGGHDGIVFRNMGDTPGAQGSTRAYDDNVYVVFSPEQIKSATGNNGDFDPANPDVRFSTARKLTPAQQAAVERVFGKPPTLADRAKHFKENWKKSAQQGIFDAFAPIKELSNKAYVLARMSRGGDSTLESLMLYGKVVVDSDGFYDTTFRQGDKPAGFASVLSELNGEHDDFLRWVAAQRAENLKKVGLENLFSKQDIAALKTLNEGTMANGKSRKEAYAQALAKLSEFNNSVLEIAEKSGLIDAETRKVYADSPYVPFYRLQEEGIAGFSLKSGLVNQAAWKRLKGGTAKLNEDLLANMLQNWSHLITASSKNRAAKATLDAAIKAGIATEVPAGVSGKGLVHYRHKGREKSFAVSDPFLMDAIAAMEGASFGPWTKPFVTAKTMLTKYVTVSPTFKIRNLIRDSIQSIAVSDLSNNPVKNVREGWKLTGKDSEIRARMLASGAMIRFGSMLDGSTSGHAQRLIRQGVDPATILDSEDKMKSAWGKVQQAFDAYQEFTDRGEQANRAALYDRLRQKGMSHGEASYMARDLMDFSSHGKWAGVRMLTMVIPFLNARLQGLYKLGRASQEDRQRLGYTLGAVALGSIALAAAYADDEDFQKREDWDRQSYWWFKVGDKALRIPKPFEVGALATVAEMGFEHIFINSDEMTAKRFAENVGDLVSNQLAISIVPQLVAPLMDVYANRDSFTGRPIESIGMERLRPEDRYTAGTSQAARFLGSLGLPDPLMFVQGHYEPLSPVKVEALVHGYFGWVGTMATTTLDYGIRPLLDEGDRPDMKLKDVFVAGNFIEDLPSGSSRYVTQMYEQAKAIEEAYNSYNAAKKLGNKERMREIATEHKDLLKERKSVDKVKREASSINTMMKQVEASKSLSGETKRRMLDKLAQERDRLAKSIVD